MPPNRLQQIIQQQFGNNKQQPAAQQPADFPIFQGPERETGLFNLINKRGGGIQQFAQGFGASAFPGLTVGAERSIPTGLATLQQILESQGRTSPDLLNRQLADIGLGTQAAQTDFQGNLARLGLQGSGVGQAIGAAIGQAGQDQRGQAIAQENALTEQRRRQDLQLLLQLLIGPSLDASAIAAGVPPKGQGPSDFESFLGFAAGALPGIGSIKTAFG